MGYSVSKPGTGGSGFRASEHIGALVAFVGVKLEVDVETQYGRSNAARVQIAVPLDGDSAGEVYQDALIFGAALVPQLTNGDTDIVVGRITIGEAKKAGQNAPYVLQEPTEAEIASVVEWLEANIKQEGDKYKVAAF